MPYVDFKKISNSEQFNDHWELRIHINPSALEQKKRNNQIKEIQSILDEVFGKENVGLKLYSISGITDKENEYDGALSRSGKDMTQVGKEVCILLPDSIISQLTTEQYKNKLLLLWRKLQEKKVPLMYMNLPGDKSICVANSLPSPFSFTSNTPNNKERNEKHGHLFKEFSPNGKHPILKEVVVFKHHPLIHQLSTII